MATSIDWKQYKCGDLFDQISTTKLKVKTKECKPFGLYPVVDQGATSYAGFIDDESKVIKISEPLCIFGDHTRLIKWIDFDFVPGADGTKILKPKGFLVPRFFYYLLRNIPLVDKGYARHFKQLKEASVSLPNIQEQKRIVDKLDSVLAKVEASQARLDKIPAILKRFRQSVLAAATSGELTKDWRATQGLELSSWNEYLFEDISTQITVGFVGKMADKYVESGIPFLRSQNVRPFKFDERNLLFISEDFHQKIYKSRLEAGDLAIVRSGAPGTTCVIPENLGVANCSDLVIVRPSEKLVSEYGCIFMNSTAAQGTVKASQVGVAQQHFNVGSMKKMLINLPTKQEQEEIVFRVNQLFEHSYLIEKKYEMAVIRVKKLEQSILSKAFKGELLSSSVDSEIESIENSVKALNA